MKITFIYSCSGMFRHVLECSAMFHVPDFIDARTISHANETQAQQVQNLAQEDFPPKLLWNENADFKFSVNNEKEKTSTRNRGAERTSPSTAKATPPTRDRGTGDWNQRHYDRFTKWKTQIS